MPDKIQTFIQGLGNFYSAMQTAEAERNFPKPEIKTEDPLKKAIIDIMTENTGCHILDSGGIYGRAWQRNRLIDDWDALPETKLEVWSSDDFYATISTYHFLYGHLEITDKSKKLNEEFQKFVDSREKTYFMQDMEDFADRFKHDSNIQYTYNYETILDHDLQFITFRVDDEEYIILQIHLGCDARDGLTRPRIFSLPEFDYFFIHMCDLMTFCPKCNISWWSDDCGHYWEGGDSWCRNRSLDGTRDLDFKCVVDSDKNLLHKNCGGILEVHGNCSY